MLFKWLLIFSLLGLCYSQCSNGWESHDGACYYFGKELRTWGSAQIHCKYLKANLAEVDTDDENNFLKSMALKNQAGDIWLGSTDLFQEGTWKWFSDKRDFKLKDWEVGEPNNLADEHCLEMRKEYGYTWNDRACYAPSNYICEKH